MHTLDTDYLVIGSGTAGLAFTDTLISQGNAHVTVVDRHGQPGGHWNDAYSFVTLHQPSSFYGVNSLELGSGRKDAHGFNQGLYELATGAEVNAYFQRVMRQVLVPSGRVTYLPMTNHLGHGEVESLLSGQRTQIRVRRKVVDAHYGGPSVPSTHTPRFEVGEGVRLVPPNALPGLWHAPSGQDLPRHFVVLGGGKTAMDTCIWLLQAGAPADAIQWVVPRDSWLINRITTQPGPEFFEASIGGQALQMEAFAAATSIDDLYLRLEACGALMRIDPTRQPTMFHLATVSQAEVALLRTISRVVRRGRVRAVEPQALVMDQGREAVEPGALFIDCTASAVEPRPSVPIFQEGRLVLQLARLPLPAFSAALIAYLEVHGGSDEEKNALCETVPFPYRLEDYPASVLAALRNQARWGQDKALRQWIRESRLDGFGKLLTGIDPTDTAKLAILARLKTQTPAAMANLTRLAAAAAATAS